MPGQARAACGRSDRGAQDLSFQELHALVRVSPGEWLDLGSVVESANEANRRILSTRRSRAAMTHVS
jgi:hypothetical protein